MLGTVFIGGLSLAHAAGSASPRAVIELYTSEGCNSCPPADRVLYELNQEHGDLLVLSFHVDYWNYLGWEDPFSSAANTERQRDYAGRLRERYVYTPQVVINGDRVVRATDKSRIVTTSNETTPLREWAQLALQPDNRTLPARGQLMLGMVDIPPAGQSYQLWLIGFDRKQERDVRSGENAGRRLIHANVVREMIDLGRWDGTQREINFALSEPCDGGVAVLVQEGRGGPVRSASVIRF